MKQKRKCFLSKMGNPSRAGYTKDDSTSQSTGRSRARKLFLCPKGYERHHIDGNELNNDPNNIKIVTPEEHRVIHNAIEKMRILGKASKGRVVSEETKLKISLAGKGRVPWNKGKHGLQTHKVSEETRKKISFANKGHKGTIYWKGKHHSKKSKQKMSVSAKLRWKRKKEL